MSLHLVTGRAGSAHINSDMVGRFNAGIIGSGSYILDTQNGLTATIESANAVTIATGDAIVQGRHVTNEQPETLTIQSGGQGVSRYDLIVIRYTNSGGIENAALTVITGTPSSSPADPSYNNGSILDGDTTVDIPLYRVVIDGLNIDHIDTLAETQSPMSEYAVAIPVIYAQDVDVATTNNGSVAPFGAYGEITPNLPSDAVPISATIIGAYSTNPCTLTYRMSNSIGSRSLSVYSHTAATIKVRIAYRIRDTFPQ